MCGVRGSLSEGGSLPGVSRRQVEESEGALWGGGRQVDRGRLDADSEHGDRQREGLWLCASGHSHTRQPKALDVPRQIGDKITR